MHQLPVEDLVEVLMTSFKLFPLYYFMVITPYSFNSVQVTYSVYRIGRIIARVVLLRWRVYPRYH